MEPLFEAVDRDGDGSATFGELLHVLYPLANQRLLGQMDTAELPPPPQPKVILNQEQLDEIREIFNLYDRDRLARSPSTSCRRRCRAVGGARRDEELFGQSDENGRRRELRRICEADGEHGAV